MVCSCGEAEDHVVMRRNTADGITVCLWSDGGVTGLLGMRLRGVPARPRRPDALAVGRLFMGEVCLFDQAELGSLYVAAKKARKIDSMPGTVLRLMREAQKPRRPVLSWHVLETDRDGKPQERVAVLPRLRWPGLAVWDYCGGRNSSRGRYELVREVSRDGCYESHGFRFRNLDDMWAHLEATS